MPPLYTFYGDDFTGSTDVLEQLASNNVPSVLFLAPPTDDQLATFKDVRAFGIAGESRSRSPSWMTANLPRIFATLRSFGAPVTHYKVCSTFDSSPTHGSIGSAIELGLAVFDSYFVPIVVGAPHLSRFVLDGKLFASASDGSIHRIDRHPMSRHPVTPMREPDLRHHLARQTDLPIGLISHENLHTLETADRALKSELDAGGRAILFDTIDAKCLRITGHLLWKLAEKRPLFSASSSGLTSALIEEWRRKRLISSEAPVSALAPAVPLLVVSGSCSSATAHQVQWALAHGFHGIPVDLDQLVGTRADPSYRARLLEAAHASLLRKEDTVLYTALGVATSASGGADLGAALGSIVNDLLSRSTVSRVVLCGGDTSSHAVQQLDLYALTWLASLQPGAPLCRAHSSNRKAAALELVLKGGQVGSEDFFAVARGLRGPSY